MEVGSSLINSEFRMRVWGLGVGVRSKARGQKPDSFTQGGHHNRFNGMDAVFGFFENNRVL